MYKKIKPEIILFKLIEQTNDIELLNKFKADIKFNSSGFGHLETYLINLYKFLQVKVLDIYYLPNNNYYCNINFKYNSNDNDIIIDYPNLLKNETNIPDILILYDYRINKLINYNIINIDYTLLINNIINKNNITGFLNHEDIITFNGIKYKLDSVIIANHNRNIINRWHAIAGITCNNNKYVYNGWSNISTDPAIVKKVNLNNEGPCSLMKYEWDLNKHEEFCLNPSLCKLDFDNIDKTDLCFSFKSDRMTLIYIRVDETKEIIKSSLTKEIKELSNIKDIIANIHDLENLSKDELKKLFFYTLVSIPTLNEKYLSKSKNELKEYLKEMLLEYYYNFGNSIELYIKNIDNLSSTKAIFLFYRLNKKYKDLDESYLKKSNKALVEYLKKIIKEKNKSPIPIVIPKKDKSKSPLVVETKDKYTKKQCDDWIANKLVNPITGRKIQEGKPVYNDFKKHCTVKSKSPIVIPKKDKSKSPIIIETKGKYTKKQCDDWIANKLVNPITGRKILQGKPVYNDLNKHCTVKSKSPIVEIKKDKVKSPKVVETKGKYTKKQCDDWIANKLVNPITKRKIQQGKPVYNDFAKHCK